MFQLKILRLNGEWSRQLFFLTIERFLVSSWGKLKIWEILSDEREQFQHKRAKENERIVPCCLQHKTFSVYFDPSWWKVELKKCSSDTFFEKTRKCKIFLWNLKQRNSFKIHPINFMSLSAIKLDQRMLSTDPSSANIKRWDFYLPAS